MTKNLVIWDLDDTLLDPSHRTHFLDHKPARWDDFFNACDGDTFIDPMLNVLLHLHEKALIDSDIHIVFLTGRSNVLQVAEKTKATLRQHGLHEHPLVLRKKGDFRKSGDFKRTWIEAHLQKYQYDNVTIIDDDIHVIEQCRDIAKTCLVDKTDYAATAERCRVLLGLSTITSPSFN